MYDACHINGTWGRKEVGWLKLLYGGGKPQIGGPSFLGGADPSRNHVLRKKTYHFQDILLRSTKGYSRCKTKIKVNNKFIQPSPPWLKILKKQNLWEPSSPLPGWCHMYTITKGNVNILPVH